MSNNNTTLQGEKKRANTDIANRPDTAKQLENLGLKGGKTFRAKTFDDIIHPTVLSTSLKTEVDSILGGSSVSQWWDSVSSVEVTSSENVPPEDITTPIRIKSLDDSQEKFVLMLSFTREELVRFGKDPNNEEEYDLWDALSVLVYLAMKRLHPLIISELCNSDGDFELEPITTLSGNDHRGVYRIKRKNYWKTGQSITVRFGVFRRAAVQFMQDDGVKTEYDSDDDDEDEEKKKLTLTDYKNYISDKHSNHAAICLAVGKAMELMRKDPLLVELVRIISELSPAFAGYDISLEEKKMEEVMIYLLEGAFASKFTGTRHQMVVEAFFCLGSVSLRELIELPTYDINREAIEILNSHGVSKDKIIVTLTWQTLISAVRNKRVELSNSTNALDKKHGDAIEDCIRGFRDCDYAGFLQKLELSKTLDTEAITLLKDYPSETYGKVEAVVGELKIELASVNNIGDQTNKSSLREIIKKLHGLERYDKPKENAYNEYANDVLEKAKDEVEDDGGMIVLEYALKESATNFGKTFSTHDIIITIKNADGTKAGELHSTKDKLLALALVTNSWHVCRGVNNSDGDRAIVGQSQVSIMTLLNQLDNKIVSDDALATQVKSLYTQLLLTEGIEGHTIGEAIKNRDLKCGGSSNKGRIATLPINTSRGDVAKPGLNLIGNVLSGKSVFDSVSGLQKNIKSGVSIDNVVVACSIVELGLANFASVMDIGYGLNSQNTGIVDGDSFSEGWLYLEHRLKCEESKNNMQGRFERAVPEGVVQMKTPVYLSPPK